MTADQLINQIKNDGLESLGLFLSRYQAIVYDAKDPEGSFRIKVECSRVLGKQISQWALPVGIPTGFGMGMKFPVKKGDPVWISFQGGDVNLPLWEYGSDPKDNSVSKGANFYTIQTHSGQKIEFDETEESITVTNKAGFKVIVEKEGIGFGKGAKKHFIPLGDIEKDILKEFIQLVSTGTAGGFPLHTAPQIGQLIPKLEKLLSKQIYILE